MFTFRRKISLIILLFLLAFKINAQEELLKYIPISLPVTYTRDTIYAQDADNVYGKYLLKEIDVFGEFGPAFAIMDSVYAHSKSNNYEKIGPYTVKAYDKASLSFDGDSLALDYYDKNWGYKTNLFMMEALSNCIVVPPNSKKETVVASKLSGFKHPQFNFYLSKMIAISIYDEEFDVMGTKYLSPINKHISTDDKRYYYNIEDTTVNAVGDTTFLLSFRPLYNQTFNGFVGEIKINTVDWAVEDVHALLVDNSEKAVADLYIDHEFYKHESGKWLPRTMTTTLLFKGMTSYMTVNDSLANSTDSTNNAGFSFVISSQPADSVIDNSNNNLRLYPQLVARRYYYEYDFDESIKKSKVGQVVYDVAADATYKSDKYWEEFRYVPLDERDINTYLIYDTLNQDINLDALSAVTTSILNWKVAIGKYFDIPLNRVIKFGSYQGTYLGLGLETSPRLCKLVSVGGYWGWGFRDAQAKWGAYTKWLLHQNTDFRVNIAYRHDVNEAGWREVMFSDAIVFKVDTYREYLPAYMDMLNTYFIDFSIKPFKSFQFMGGLHKTNKTPMYEYTYDGKGNFNFTTAHFGMRIAVNEKFSKTPYGLKSLGTKFPILTIRYERGLNGVFDGEFSYNKIDVQLTGKYKVGKGMAFSFDLLAGYLDSDIPYSNMYAALAGYFPFTFFAPSSFGTMRMGEFTSDLFAQAFIQYDFASLFETAVCRPAPSIVYNFGYGELRNVDFSKHTGKELNAMNKGYHEIGLMLNGILATDYTSLGLGVMYRLGAYSFPTFKDNLAFKFCVGF